SQPSRRVCVPHTKAPNLRTTVCSDTAMAHTLQVPRLTQRSGAVSTLTRSCSSGGQAQALTTSANSPSTRRTCTSFRGTMTGSRKPENGSGLLSRVSEPLCTRTSSIRTPKIRRSEEHTSELQSRFDLVCRLLLEKKKYKRHKIY